MKEFPYRKFVQIPMQLVLCHDLHGSAMKTYGALCLFANKSNVCWPSIHTLARITGLSKRQIARHLKDLEREGLITIKRRGKRKGKRGATSLYKLTFNFRGFSFAWQAIMDGRRHVWQTEPKTNLKTCESEQDFGVVHL